MGKESEILQAAQDGNIAKLETLLVQRQPKVLAGLFKGPNVNWRDDSGCTALHLAALNGHKDAVIFLLQIDASANIPDNAGSYPLHLAAFNGHHDVAKTLITKGPSRAQVNESNMAGDTALHVAAQYGHRYVVQVLLENHAEPSVRNAKEETALDLAAQYGRLSTVQLFLVFDVKVLQDAVHKHSPLHLAARNGHEDVVKILLDSGMPINAACDMGTALHCAALFGKVGVAKLLLNRGIDIDIEDDNHEKVLDLLCRHPSQRSQEITALVYEQSSTAHNVKERSPAASFSGMQFEMIESKERPNSAPLSPKHVVRPPGYDFVPPPRPRPKDLDDDSDDSSTERPYSVIHGPLKEDYRLSNVGGDDFDLASITPLNNSNNESFFKNYTSQSNASEKGVYCVVSELEAGKNQRRESDIKKFRRPSTDRRPKGKTNSPVPIDDGTYTYLRSDSSNGDQSPSLEFSAKPLTGKTKFSDYDSNIKQSPTSTNNMVKQSPMVDNLYQVPANSNYAERRESNSSSTPDFTSFANSPVESSVKNTATSVSPYSKRRETKARSQTLPATITTYQPELYDNVNLTKTVTQDVYDNVNISNSPVASSSYDNINITNKPGSVKNDLLPVSEDSYYQSPPCTVLQPKPTNLFTKKPDSKIQQYTSVKTKSMKQKRTTIIRPDVPLEEVEEVKPITNSIVTEAEPIEEEKQVMKNKDDAKTFPLQDKVDEKAPVSVTQSSDQLSLNKSPHVISLDKISNETKIDDDSDTPIPKPRTKVKQNRTSIRSVSSGYRMSTINQQQPLNESYEWNKIDNFLTDLEQFAGSPEAESKPLPSTVSIANVNDWLNSIGLSQYEPMFMTNGFDDISFIGGSLENNDLIELGILAAEHRKVLIEAANNLSKPAVIGDDDFPIPTTVGEWLKKLKLDDYEGRFNYNGYDNIDRIRVIWELELVTVLDITTLGHRKRMLNSLGRRPPVIKSDISWAQRFADADAGKKKTPIVDDSMEVAKKLLEYAQSLKSGRAQRQTSKDGDSVDASRKPPPIPSRTDLGEAVANTSDNSQATDRKALVSTTLTSSNWKHCADTLLYESVSYNTQYLGSHPVQQVRGVTSTLEACRKMKAISRNVHKMPSITLSISVRGIDYIDSNSKMIISQYAINHISFCAQDPADLCMFAYITRDQQTNKHYCHVFRAGSVNLADEIIMSIGQCFELAYEQHVAMVEMKKMKKSLENSTQAAESDQKPRAPPPKPIPYAERMTKKSGATQ